MLKEASQFFRMAGDLLVLPKRFGRLRERAFLREHAERFRSTRQVAIVLALIIWTTFGYWDFRNAERHPADFTDSILAQLLVLRLAGVCSAWDFSGAPMASPGSR